MAAPPTPPRPCPRPPAALPAHFTAASTLLPPSPPLSAVSRVFSICAERERIAGEAGEGLRSGCGGAVWGRRAAGSPEGGGGAGPLVSDGAAAAERGEGRGERRRDRAEGTGRGGR